MNARTRPHLSIDELETVTEVVDAIHDGIDPVHVRIDGTDHQVLEVDVEFEVAWVDEAFYDFVRDRWPDSPDPVVSVHVQTFHHDDEPMHGAAYLTVERQ